MLSRRQFLARGGALVAASAALAACGSSLPLPGTPRPALPGTLITPSLPAAPPAPPNAGPVPVARPVRRSDYPVARENRLPGTAAWDQGRWGIAAAEGYVSKASVGPGEPFTLHLGSIAGPVDADWYRLGWYGGAGGRLVRQDRGLRAVLPVRPRPEPDLGLVEAGWAPALELTAGPDWTSGSYLAVLKPTRGDAGYVPFVVRPPAPKAQPGGPAPILFVSAATTWQAYNAWGGKSLYNATSSGIDMPAETTRAVEVSFDRPHLVDQGAGIAFGWEIQFVRWQERHRRDVEYVADVDLVLHPELLAGRRLLVFAGHHEYWSRGMRDALEAQIAAGTNVVFLSANEIYQQVRLSDSPLGPARRVTCYKVANDDPLHATAPSLTSIPWRSSPIDEPEAAVVGQMYAHVVERPADWRVINADHWLYAGTGLREGDLLRNLVGQEYDTFYPDLAPPGTMLLASSPVMPNCIDPTTPRIHTATLYTAPSGATVFAAGTMQWSWALDSFGVRSYAGIRTPLDKRVGIMTANLFNRLGDGPARQAG